MTKRLGLVIDQERCIGCEACTVACKTENKGTEPWIRVKTQNAAQKDTPEGRFPDLKMTFFPELCNHCDNPPCVDACPLEALIKREDGPVILYEEACDGCQACLDACPFDAIFYNQERGKVEKCNLCVHRIDQGMEPFCVICCEGQAIYFGDLNDPATKASQMIGGEETGLSIHYRPPKAPRGL